MSSSTPIDTSASRRSPAPTTSATLAPRSTSATLAPRSTSPPSGNKTSSPGSSPKVAVIGPVNTDFSKTSSSHPRSDAEHIAATAGSHDFGFDSARRASMPAKYQTRDLNLLSRAFSPPPSARGSEPDATPLRPVPTSSAPTAPAPTAPAPTAPPPTAPAPTAPASVNPPPYVDDGSTIPHDEAFVVVSSTAQEVPADGEAPPADSEAPPPYHGDGVPGSTQRTQWLTSHLYSRLDTLTFNLPGPLYRPITRDTLIRKGRKDLVEGKTIGDIGNTLFAHARTWKASRCNVSVPHVDPRWTTVKCKVLSDSPHFESPTHLLVLVTGAGKDMTYTYVPVHDLVYLTQCTGLRSGIFPPSFPERKQEEDGSYSVTLPVVLLPVPANHCFGLLDDYLYSRNLTFFFQQLVSPITPNLKERHFENNYQRCQFYVKLLITKFSFPQIARRLLAIHHLHQDAVHLGVVDPSFWRVVNVAWFSCGAALKAKKRELLDNQTLSDSLGQGAGRSASMPDIPL